MLQQSLNNAINYRSSSDTNRNYCDLSPKGNYGQWGGAGTSKGAAGIKG